VQRTLDRSTIPPVDMSAAAERNIAATHEPGDLKLPPGGSVGAKKSSLSSLAGKVHRTANDGPGPEGNQPSPAIIVDTAPPRLNGIISDADSVIARLRPRFRKCYQDGLLSDPSMGGKAVIVAKLGPNGEVQSTEVGSNEGLSSGVTGCLQKVVGNAQFTGNGAVTTMRIPVSLVKQ
jgi:hypothetical protein